MDVLSSILVILAVAVIMLSFLYISNVAALKEDIKQVARGYLLEMETVGYLTPESRITMSQELAEIGLTNIDLSGTTQAAVGYGNDIVLSVKGALPVKLLNTAEGDMLSFFFEDVSWEIAIYMQSTAKH